MKNIYTVKDAESQTYIPPFSMNTDRDAVESFRYVINNEKDSPYAKFPKDFAIYNIGKFNELTGEIVLNPNQTQIKLYSAHELINKEQ